MSGPLTFVEFDQSDASTEGRQSYDNCTLLQVTIRLLCNYCYLSMLGVKFVVAQCKRKRATLDSRGSKEWQ
jgi:hypothetical protein